MEAKVNRLGGSVTSCCDADRGKGLVLALSLSPLCPQGYKENV